MVFLPNRLAVRVLAMATGAGTVEGVCAVAAVDQVRNGALLDGVAVVTHLLLLVTKVDIHEISMMRVFNRRAGASLKSIMSAV